MMATTDKLILDACCGSRMFWFDKQNPLVLFQDIRSESHILCDGRGLTISPDIQADFTAMPYIDNSFHLVVFDPPHSNNIGEKAWMALKYGKLPKEWQLYVKRGLDECMRVLKPNGILVFKWNEHRLKISEVLKAIDYKPLFGHTSGRQNKTIWMAFMKMEQ